MNPTDSVLAKIDQLTTDTHPERTPVRFTIDPKALGFIAYRNYGEAAKILGEQIDALASNSSASKQALAKEAFRSCISPEMDKVDTQSLEAIFATIFD